MYGNDIGDEGIQAFATNTTLTMLEVRVNTFGDAGAQALAANTTLKTLDVGNDRMLNANENKISDVGAQALAANTTLTSLDVSENNIGNVGARALLSNTTLISLDLYLNRLIEAGLEEALKLLTEQNKKRLANVAGLTIAVTSFRANQASEIKASIVPLIPLIHEWAGFKMPTVRMDRVINATFFNNLVHPSGDAVERKEKKPLLFFAQNEDASQRKQNVGSERLPSIPHSTISSSSSSSASSSSLSFFSSSSSSALSFPSAPTGVKPPAKRI